MMAARLLPAKVLCGTSGRKAFHGPARASRDQSWDSPPCAAAVPRFSPSLERQRNGVQGFQNGLRDAGGRDD